MADPQVLSTGSLTAFTPSEFSALIEANSSFSFLRLGDGELRFLLEMQEGSLRSRPMLPFSSCQIAFGNPGLTEKDYHRLLRSYEGGTVVDLYADLPYNRQNLHRLQWERPADKGWLISSGNTGFIFQWLFSELRQYLSRHRCLVCGAEAALLRELLNEPEYRQILHPFWPDSCEVFFLQPVRDGRFLSEDLDQIKHDASALIKKHAIDTVFLSLGGAAKIIAYELSKELHVRVIDWGSALRSLTYSGSDGFATWRAPHHVFLVRVPFGVYMRALGRAHPEFDATAILTKAHAQLCLELQAKTLLCSNTSDVNDLSMYEPCEENLRNFYESFRTYNHHYRRLGRKSEKARHLIREFDAWRRRKGLGWDGKLFRAAVFLKGCMRKAHLVP